MARLSKAEKAAIASEETQYFVQIPNEFFELGLSPYELAAYAWMKRRYGTGKRGVFESVSNMAKAVGMSTRRFHTAIDRLVDANVIRSEGKTLTVKYILHDKAAWIMPPSAPRAEAEAAPSARGAERSLHVVQKDSARGADKVDTRSRYQEEREGASPRPDAQTRESQPSPSLDSQIETALADSDSAEARAFLTANGINTDKRPLWDLQKFLRQTLGDQADHPQVTGNTPAWVAAGHSLQDVRAAWQQAVARRKREPSGLRAVLHFVDILNGVYKPDSHDLEQAEAARSAAVEQATAAAPKPGDRVRIINTHTVRTVHDFDPTSGWVVLQDHPDLFRPDQLQVIQ